MFDFLKLFKSSGSNKKLEYDSDNDDNEVLDDILIINESQAAGSVAKKAIQEANIKFAKPEQYDRSIIEDKNAMRTAKQNAFQSKSDIFDPYTNDRLFQTQAEARANYGEDYAYHSAEPDHIIPLEERYKQTKNNPWLSNSDIKKSSNEQSRIRVVSRKFNNAKRSKSNRKFVNDTQTLKSKDITLTNEGKQLAIQDERQAQRAVNFQDFKDSTKNLIQTGHQSGLAGAQNAALAALVISIGPNIEAVISGKKDAKEAVEDVAKTVGKGAATGYVISGGLTTVSHSLSSTSSPFIKALTKSNVPSQIITSVMLFGKTLQRYGNGEISTQECLMELGEKGINFAASGYGAVVGQALIPIPVIGGAIGAMVTSAITSSYINELVNTLHSKELEHQKRLRIIEECNRATDNLRQYREKLENYLEKYFYEYEHCFDESFLMIQAAFEKGNADGIIMGANQITQKLGGHIYYNNTNEFHAFLLSDSLDVF